jgi:hypothetical protein
MSILLTEQQVGALGWLEEADREPGATGDFVYEDFIPLLKEQLKAVADAVRKTYNPYPKDIDTPDLINPLNPAHRGFETARTQIINDIEIELLKKAGL